MKQVKMLCLLVFVMLCLSGCMEQKAGTAPVDGTAPSDATAPVDATEKTYQITYDFSHNSSSTDQDAYEVHMEWHDIQIDWTVESEESLQLASSLGYPDMYCLTDTENTSGYAPSVLTEHSPYTDGGEMKVSKNPTLSFYRGAEKGMFEKDAYYVDLQYEVALYVDGQCIPMPIAVELVPLSQEHEDFFEKQGWGELSRIARLERKDSESLINEGEPLIITYEDKDPAIFKFKLVIEPEE